MTMTDEATVSGNETDPNPTMTPTVFPLPSRAPAVRPPVPYVDVLRRGDDSDAPDDPRYRWQVVQQADHPRQRGTGSRPGSIDEFDATLPQFDGFCGGRDCDTQVQITVLPQGQTPANNPIQVFWFYVKDKSRAAPCT